MLTLYHGSTSVCSAKVRLVLSEKAIAWSGVVLDLQKGDQHSAGYVALNPNAVVPTLVDEGQVVVESSIIMEYLEDRFPTPALMPDDALGRARVRSWLRVVDDRLHSAAGSVMFATANRKALLKKSPEELADHFARIPDPAYRERQRSAVELGLDAPNAADALRVHDGIFHKMDVALRDAEFLVGSAFSLADAALLPYVNRCSLLGLAPVMIENRKSLAAWWDRMQKRPSFEEAVQRPMRPGDYDRFDLDRDAISARARLILGQTEMSGPEA